MNGHLLNRRRSINVNDESPVRLISPVEAIESRSVVSGDTAELDTTWLRIPARIISKALIRVEHVLCPYRRIYLISELTERHAITLDYSFVVRNVSR